MTIQSVGLASRRKILAGLAASAAAMRPAAAAQDSLPLRVRAARRGLLYGSAVQSGPLVKDVAFGQTIADECAILTPEWEMKWGATEARRGMPDYARAETIVAFAKRNGLALRGHAAAWHANLPGWGEPVLRGPEGWGVFENHVRAVVSQFAGSVAQWDVVNEGLFPSNRQADGIGNTILFQSFGKRYILEPFFWARESDSKALLFYNDENLFYDDPDHEARRRATLKLLAWLKSEKAPVDGLGIESHLFAGGPRFDAAIYRAFLRDVAALGLRIMITELDVSDRFLGPDIAERDRAVADHAARYLNTVLDEPAVKGVVTWGLSDRYTWLNGKHRWRRTDGLPARGLPLDAALIRKPLWEALARAFDGAPDRKP